jgi:hydrogenase large subunit
MGTTIVIDPLVRIEGHSKWTVTVAGVIGAASSAVTNAQASGTMFRGFENIMNKRDPRDAPVICQRI